MADPEGRTVAFLRDVEVRGYPGGFLVIVESLEQSIALGERLQLVGRQAAA